jgi:hypothetical protein
MLTVKKRTYLPSTTSLSAMGSLRVPSVEGRASEALDDEAGVFVSMLEPVLLEWLLVIRPKPKNDILSHKEQKTQRRTANMD